MCQIANGNAQKAYKEALLALQYHCLLATLMGSSPFKVLVAAAAAAPLR
jgi:hypothetical protein